MTPLKELLAGVIERFRRGRCVKLGCDRAANGRSALCFEHELEQRAKNARRVDELLRQRVRE